MAAHPTTSDVNAVDLSRVTAKLCEPTRDRAAWTPEFAEGAVREYRRFFLLLARHQPRGRRIVPSHAVDEVWHQHILFTAEYARDCAAMATGWAGGPTDVPPAHTYLHHRPCPVPGDPDAARLQADIERGYQETLHRYHAEFGDGSASLLYWRAPRASVDDETKARWPVSAALWAAADGEAGPDQYIGRRVREPEPVWRSGVGLLEDLVLNDGSVDSGAAAAAAAESAPAAGVVDRFDQRLSAFAVRWPAHETRGATMHTVPEVLAMLLPDDRTASGGGSDSGATGATTGSGSGAGAGAGGGSGARGGPPPPPAVSSETSTASTRSEAGATVAGLVRESETVLADIQRVQAELAELASAHASRELGSVDVFGRGRPAMVGGHAADARAAAIAEELLKAQKNVNASDSAGVEEITAAVARAGQVAREVRTVWKAMMTSFRGLMSGVGMSGNCG